MNRIIQNKTQNLQTKKTYPTRMYLLQHWEYDPKELSHALRVLHLLRDYIQGRSFENELLGIKDTEKLTEETRALLIRLKREPFLTYEEALEWGREIAVTAQEIADLYAKRNPYWYGNKEVDTLLNKVRRKMMILGLEKEIKE